MKIKYHCKLMPMLMALFIVTSSEGQDCIPPTNQATALKFSSVASTTLKIDFTAAAAGSKAADSYLVAATSGNAPPQPVNGQAYNIDDLILIGTAQVLYVGSATSCTIQHLQPSTKYNIFVFSVANTNICYNTSKPLTDNVTTTASDAPPEINSDASATSSKLSPLLNFNFAGKQNSWSNFTPVVFYGWTISGMTSVKKKGAAAKDFCGSALQIGPYIGSTINIKDSTSYLPALMLPGNAGIEINYFLTFGNEKKFSVVFSPLNLGMKVISGFTDSSVSIVQHDIRNSIAIRYGDYFTLSAQYTQGWHNLTTQSEQYYKQIFPGAPEKISYWNLTLSTRLSDDLFGGKTKTPLYLAVNWRSLVNPKQYGNLPNSRFISIGLVTNLDLKSGSNSGMLPKAPNPNP